MLTVKPLRLLNRLANTTIRLTKWPTMSRSAHDGKEPDGESAFESRIPSLFSGQTVSKNYVENRHSYSEEVFQVISDYCRESVQDLNLAVDVGCGPGNSTVGFTKHFKKVIGVDLSETQIAQAPDNIPNCEFRVGCATNMDFLAPGSVDLFASGLAFYLMPREKTLAEADRVLRPGGTLAVFGYSMPTPSNKQLNAIFTQTFSDVLHQMPEKMVMAMKGHKDIELPYPGWIRREGLLVQQKISFEGLVAALSFFDRLLTGAPDEDDTEGDFLRGFRHKLAEAFPDSMKDPTRKDFELVYDVYITMGHKPLR